MAIEIERKFLVKKSLWQLLEKPEGKRLQQGYIYAGSEKSVRVRMAGDKGFLTIKGASAGMARPEYEYEIPAADAAEMLRDLCGQLISKVRYRMPYMGLIWEVDAFEEANEGLIVAEVELESEQTAIRLPEWIAEEVSGDTRYYNSSLAQCPYKYWERQP